MSRSHQREQHRRAMTEATDPARLRGVAALDSRRRAVAMAMALKAALALCFVVALAVTLLGSRRS